MASNAPPPADPRLLDEAVALCRAAGEMTLRWFRSSALAVDRKHDGTPVTEADRAAERFLRDELGSRHPDDAVIGEEEADSDGSSGRTWIIDPIDGTKSFTHGVPLYSNLLALYDDDGPLLGVINLPALGETVYAGRGLGCFADGHPVVVNDVDDLGASCLCTSGLTTWDDAALGRIRGAGALVRTWGDGYGFALLATGRIEAMADPAVAIWDIAPIPVIVREAGGRFTDFAGNDRFPLDAGGEFSALASNGARHDELLALVAGTG
jgi:histidinol-phosphatase